MTSTIPEEPIVYQTLIPQGQTREEIQQRRKIIKNFYASWIAINPTKHIFNIALKILFMLSFCPFRKRQSKRHILINQH